MAWVNALIVAVIAWIGFYFGGPLSLVDQWGYMEALRSTTSIVFGVMGALLAIIYPEVIKGEWRSGVPTGDAKNMRRVLDPCAHSGILLIVLVILGPVYAWLRGQAFAPADLMLAQKISFSVFCMLTFWQIRILLMVLFPLDGLLTSTDATSRRERLRKAIHSNGR